MGGRAGKTRNIWLVWAHLGYPEEGSQVTLTAAQA
jgi:hypothetical protein